MQIKHLLCGNEAKPVQVWRDSNFKVQDEEREKSEEIKQSPFGGGGDLSDRDADSLHSLMGSSLQSEQSRSWLQTLLSSMHSPLRHLNLSRPLHADAAQRKSCRFSQYFLSFSCNPGGKGAK